MIGSFLDSVIGAFSPTAGLRRMHARRIMRAYNGAQPSRLTNHSHPKNQSANAEMAGPFGADALRKWARQLVRDNAYAWGVVDTIVSSVVENGIRAQSTLETDEGQDVEEINWARDETWSQWCEVCDFNGEYTFGEIQRIAQREIVEAGEVLLHFVKTPSNAYRGISRPVPLAIELIEADRLAITHDRYRLKANGENRIVRGVELDEYGRAVAYWIHPQHPSDVATFTSNEPVRILASEVLHLFRRDRIGQTRGVTWFAPVVSWLRDLGVYVDNELQASTVAACFSAFIKQNNGMPSGISGVSGADTTDDRGNRYEFLEPGMIMYGSEGEGVEVINPTRPNSGAEPWINLMLRGIAVGTGLSYEVVARDYSKTNYSSSRTSQLEDRRRFRCWQNYLVNHLCQPVWDRFCEAAAAAGLKEFPTASELLEDRRKVAPVEWQTPEWEWVDPQAEQTASQNSIDALQSTYATELGSRGRNWKSTFYQRAKEEKLKRSLGLATLDQAKINADLEISEQATQSQQASADTGTGEMGEASRLQWGRNQKAIQDVLDAFMAGTYSRVRASVMLSTLGLSSKNVDLLLDDAADGTLDGVANEEAISNG